MDGFAEGLHLYWAWEVDDIEDRIIFQILEWRNDIAQSRGKEKKFDWPPAHDYSPHTWSPRGKKEIKRKDSMQNPAADESLELGFVAR